MVATHKICIGPGFEEGKRWMKGPDSAHQNMTCGFWHSNSLSTPSILLHVGILFHTLLISVQETNGLARSLWLCGHTHAYTCIALCAYDPHVPNPIPSHLHTLFLPCPFWDTQSEPVAVPEPG